MWGYDRDALMNFLFPEYPWGNAAGFIHAIIESVVIGIFFDNVVAIGPSVVSGCLPVNPTIVVSVSEYSLSDSPL